MAKKSTSEAPTLVYFPKLGKKLDVPQEGVMKVGSQILELLSKGIYSAPENALKEVISNAFDADATKVQIRFLPEEDKLEITDDGEGMDYNDFDQHFAFISRSGKRDEGEITKKYKRPIIGKIGIGFIAVSELCDSIRVKSAKSGSDSWFEAKINFKPFKGPEAKKREFYEVSKYVLTNHSKTDINEHYTVLSLEGLTAQFKDVLLNKTPDEVQLLEMPKGDFLEILARLDSLAAKRTLNIRRDLGPLWSFLFNLANIIPTAYPPGGPIRVATKATRIIREISQTLKSYNFSVDFGGLTLLKTVRFPYREVGRVYRERTDFDVFPVSFRNKFRDGSTLRVTGYIYNQRKSIPIEESRGIVVRIRNTSIGGPDPGFLAYPYPGEKLFFPWTYGELYVTEGLEDAMNIDRSSFKLGHPHYRKLRSFLHDFLHDTVFRNAKDRYVGRMKIRARNELELRESTRGLMLQNAFGKRLEVLSARRSGERPLSVRPDESRLIFYMKNQLFLGLTKSERELVKDILIAFESALMQSPENIDKMRLQFWKYLGNLFHKKDEINN